MTRVLVLRSPGTNCDEETARAFALAGAEAERIHAGALIRRERRLDEFGILAFPGGFSYGDDLGAGTVLANRLRARLADELRAFVESGRLVIGICNGFQVLVRLGLLPGWEGGKAVSLIENASGKFEDRWVRLRVATDACPFLGAPRSLHDPAPALHDPAPALHDPAPALHDPAPALHDPAPAGGKGTVLRLPVAHREGRFVARDPEVLERLEAGGQVALRYASGEGGAAFPPYPENPNGSLAAIAGITNPAGNVLGLMPHPERHVRALHDPLWTRRAVGEGIPEPEERSGDGFPLFERAVRHAREAGW